MIDLSRLQKLDPDLWRQIQSFRIQHERRGRGDLTECDERFQDTLQGLLQRRIAAKGWKFMLYQEWPNLPTEPGRFMAAIAYKNGWPIDACGDSPCAALLAAYVACLEAQPRNYQKKKQQHSSQNSIAENIISPAN